MTTTLLLECPEQANYIALRACYAPPIESIQLNLPTKANMPNPCNGGRRRVIGTNTREVMRTGPVRLLVIRPKRLFSPSGATTGIHPLESGSGESNEAADIRIRMTKMRHRIPCDEAIMIH